MSRPSKPARKKAAASKAAAVRADRKTGKTITWKGVKFDLPDNMPKAILFDFIDIEAEGSDPAPVFRMLRSLVGPAQFVKLRNAVEQGDAEPDDVFELVRKILKKYGVGTGE